MELEEPALSAAPLSAAPLSAALDRILNAIYRNRDLLCLYPKSTGYDDRRLTAENIADLSCNHLFDDVPGRFGISEQDGLIVREYIHHAVADRSYGHVLEMHARYKFLDAERAEFLARANRNRKEAGLEPIVMETVEL